MKLKYYKKDDILIIRLSNEPYDYAEMEENFVVHYSKKEKPVLIEVLNASQSFDIESKKLLRKFNQNFLTARI